MDKVVERHRQKEQPQLKRLAFVVALDRDYIGVSGNTAINRFVIAHNAITTGLLSEDLVGKLVYTIKLFLRLPADK